MKNKVSILIIGIVMVTLAFVAVYIIRNKDGGETVTATISTVENSVQTDGYMVRNEQLIDVAGAKYVRMYCKNGDKVARNAKIVSLYNNAKDGNTISEIEEIENEIAGLSSDYVTLTSSDVIKVEGYIDDGIDALGMAAEKGKLADALSETEKLNTLFDIKYTNGTETENTEAELEKRKTALEETLSSDKSDILSPVSGVFAAKTDGYEGMLTPEKAMTLTVGEFNGIKQLSPIEMSKNSCKVVDNYRWYMVFIVPADKLLNEQVGDSVTLMTEQGERIKARIEYISDSADGECVVTVSSATDFYGITGERNCKIKLIFSSYTGYVLPANAFHMYNGEYGVFVKQNNNTIFKKTKVIYSSNEYCVVSSGDDGGLTLYDTVVTEGDLSEYYN